MKAIVQHGVRPLLEVVTGQQPGEPIVGRHAAGGGSEEFSAVLARAVRTLQTGSGTAVGRPTGAVKPQRARPLPEEDLGPAAEGTAGAAAWTPSAPVDLAAAQEGSGQGTPYGQGAATPSSGVAGLATAGVGSAVLSAGVAPSEGDSRHINSHLGGIVQGAAPHGREARLSVNGAPVLPGAQDPSLPLTRGGAGSEVPNGLLNASPRHLGPWSGTARPAGKSPRVSDAAFGVGLEQGGGADDAVTEGAAASRDGWKALAQGSLSGRLAGRHGLARHPLASVRGADPAARAAFAEGLAAGVEGGSGFGLPFQGEPETEGLPLLSVAGDLASGAASGVRGRGGTSALLLGGELALGLLAGHGDSEAGLDAALHELMGAPSGRSFEGVLDAIHAAGVRSRAAQETTAGGAGFDGVSGAPSDVGESSGVHHTSSSLVPPALAARVEGGEAVRADAEGGGFPSAGADVSQTGVRLAADVVRLTAPVRAGGAQEALLHLHPEELGRLVVRVSVEEERVHLQMKARDASVKALLESHIPLLRHALGEQGLRLEQVRIDVASGAEGGTPGSLDGDRGAAGAGAHTFAGHGHSRSGGPEGSVSRSAGLAAAGQEDGEGDGRPAWVGRGIYRVDVRA